MKKLLFLFVLSLSILLSTQTAFGVTIDSPADGATSTSRPVTFEGTSTPNADIALKEDGSEIATTTADSNGDWTITTSDVTDGEHDYRAEATSEGVWAFMNPSQDGRVDVVDMDSHDFATSFEVPEPYLVNDLQVSGLFLFVLATNSATTTCEMFAYYTDTLEIVPVDEPMVISTSCSGINFDVMSNTLGASVLFYNPVDEMNHVVIYDLEDGEFFEDLELGPNPINTIFSTANNDLYVHYEGSMERFDITAGVVTTLAPVVYSATATTKAVLVSGDAYIIYGDEDGNIVERQANDLNSVNSYPVNGDGPLNLVAAADDVSRYFATGYNGVDYSIWEFNVGSHLVLSEETFDQYPESLGVATGNEEWVIGDNHSFGFIYFGNRTADAITHTIQNDGASYRNSSDDFFSIDETHVLETEITLTNPAESESTVSVNYAGSNGGTVAPGGKVSLTGSGFEANSQITITLYSTPVLLATLQTNSQGSFSTQVTIPKNTSLGQHSLEIAGTKAGGGSVSSILPLNVVLLPATGNSPQEKALFASFLILAGFVLARTKKNNLLKVS